MRKYFISILLHFGWLLLISNSLLAQNNSNHEILTSLKGAATRFMKLPNIQFDMTYRYANEEEPSIYLDSIKGSSRIWGNKYWYSIENTEVLCDSASMIIVFNEDKLIYLTNPTTNNSPFHSLALIDSLLLERYPITCSIEKGKINTKYIIEFLRPTAYKKLEYIIDNRIGLILMARQFIRSGNLYDKSIPSGLNPDNWVIVDLHYDNYRIDKLDPTFFDINRYVLLKESGFIPAPAYSQYSVFDANPKL